MEVFSQKTRDALYGRFFLYAEPGKEPDMLRIVNFTATGVQFGRVVMKVTKCEEHCFTSEPDHTAGLLLIPGSKHITVTLSESGSELYSYADLKTGNVYNSVYTSCLVAAVATANECWRWSPGPIAKTKSSGGGGSKRTSSGKPKPKKRAVEKAEAVDGSKAPSSPVVAPVADAKKPQQRSHQQHEPQQQQQQQQQQPKQQKNPSASSATKPCAKPSAAPPAARAATATKKPPSVSRASTLTEQAVETPYTSIEALIDENAPEIGEFLDDLREGDEQDNDMDDPTDE